MLNNQVRILLVEDEPISADITLRMLKEAGLDSAVCVRETLAAGIRELDAGGTDLVLLDLGLPDSQGRNTVRTVCEKFTTLPIVVMTGTDDDSMWLDVLQDGAQDYLVKSQFGDRELKRAIRYALERKNLLNEKESLIVKLQEAITRVKQLTGLLPICSDCKKIRTDNDNWVQLESYISEHSEAQFTHGLCRSCYEKYKKDLPPGSVKAGKTLI
jgi:DNA-binding response OmpR family regulator